MIPILVPFSQGQLNITAGHTYAMWNPSDKSAAITLSGGNLIATSGSGADIVRSTIGKSSGKWYWEYTVSTSDVNNLAGIADGSAGITNGNYPGIDTHGWGYYESNGNSVTNASFVAYGNSYTTSDVIGIALDMTNGAIYFAKNNTWQNSGNPVAGTGYAYNGLSGTIYAACGHGGGAGAGAFTANFGATAFTYTPPTGYNSGLYT